MIKKEVIDFVLKRYTRNTKNSASKIRDYIRKFEPDFEQYLSTSTINDIKYLIEKHGIPPSQEIMNSFTSILTGAKLEGFLIHSISQDQFWSHKYGIDIEGGLKPEDRFERFLEGKMDPKYYEYELTDKEKNDPDNYKTKAKNNFIKNQQKLSLENKMLDIKKDVKKPETNTNEKKNVSMPGDLLS